jgi:hypothetical protein
MRESEVVDLEFEEIVHETERAYKLRFEDVDDDVWVPISLAEIDRDERVVTVPAWWADKEGLG